MGKRIASILEKKKFILAVSLFVVVLVISGVYAIDNKQDGYSFSTGSNYKMVEIDSAGTEVMVHIAGYSPGDTQDPCDGTDSSCGVAGACGNCNTGRFDGYDPGYDCGTIDKHKLQWYDYDCDGTSCERDSVRWKSEICDFYCSTVGTDHCTDGEVGEKCGGTSSTNDDDCKSGLHCGNDGVCLDCLPWDDDCSSDSDCCSGFCGRAGDNECRNGETGDSCGGNKDCKSLMCSGGDCEAKFGLYDEWCWHDENCESGFCGKDGAHECRIGEIGHYCSGDKDCKYDNCNKYSDCSGKSCDDDSDCADNGIYDFCGKVGYYECRTGLPGSLCNGDKDCKSGSCPNAANNNGICD